MFKIRKTSHLLEGLGGGAVIAGLLLASAGSAFADTKTIGLSGVASNFTVAPDPGPGDSGGFGDTIPDAFSFTAVTGAVKDTPTASNTVTISGLSEPVPVTVSGTGLPQIRINNGSLVSSGTISNGDTLMVSLVPSAWSSTYEALVTVGDGAAVAFSVSSGPTPSDTIADAFSFTPVTGVAKNASTESNTVTIAGLSEPVSVSVSGTGLPQISINGGSFVSSGTIGNGDTLKVSLVPSAWGSTYEAQVTVGGGTAVAFSVASASAPTVGLAASTLPDGDVNQAYNAGTGFDFKTLASLAGGSASNPPTAADLSWTSGTLPAGMTLSALGVLSGTPTTSGEYTFTVTATLETGIQDSQTYTVYIFADPLVIEGGN